MAQTLQVNNSDTKIKFIIIIFFRMKLFEAFSLVSVFSILQAGTVPFGELTNTKTGATTGGILSRNNGGAAFVTGSGPVQHNLGNGSLKTELVKTILGRLLQHGGDSQEQPVEG